MSVFSYEGEKDTIMTPMDSLKYYKFFLRAGIYVYGSLDRACEGICGWS